LSCFNLLICYEKIIELSPSLVQSTMDGLHWTCTLNLSEYNNDI